MERQKEIESKAMEQELTNEDWDKWYHELNKKTIDKVINDEDMNVNFKLNGTEKEEYDRWQEVF